MGVCTMEQAELKSLLEALLFTATEPLTLDHFHSVMSDVDQDMIRAIAEKNDLRI